MIEEKIYIGSLEAPTLAFDNDSIESITCNNAVDLIGDELSSDALEVSVFCDDINAVFDGYIYGTPIWYYSNEELVGKYYINQVERKAPKKYLIHATSLIGIVANEDFYGGFYNAAQFPDVVDDILLTDGIFIDKYDAYTPINSRNQARPTPVIISDKVKGTNAWGYRSRIKFIPREINSAGYDWVFGYVGSQNNQRYTVVAISGYSYSIGGVVHHYSIYYGENTLNIGDDEQYGLIGNGSIVTIDINPSGGYMSADVDYVLPGQTTVSGHISKRIDIQVNPNPESEIDLGCVYGASWIDGTVQSCQQKLQWLEQKTWDEAGDLVVDVVFLQKRSPSRNIIINTVDQYMVTTTHYAPYGDRLGVVGDLTRIRRDVELSGSISYSEIVSAILVYGWIETGSRRDALHKLMFAENVCLLKTDDGDIIFTELQYGDDEERISEADTYDDSSEKYIENAKKISVTENSYEAGTGEAVKLFDNSSSALRSGEYIVLFNNAPISGTPTGNGITILHSNCNAAIVTGRGTITGVPYIHSQNQIQYVNGEVMNGKDVSVSGIGLITDINSDNVMNKLKSYYSGSVKEVDNSLVYHGERCGKNYALKTLYREQNYGFLTNMSAAMSSFVKAVCKFVTGYVLTRVGGYTQFAIATYTETWNIPSDVRSQTYPEIRLNIIGKGIDGTDGADGEDGEYTEEGRGIKDPGAGGAGGSKGLGGSGGKVYVVTVDVTNVNQIQVTKSGTDTIVKTYNDGGTLLNTYSSASGNVLANGFLNTFNGEIYAEAGLDGYDGGNGGAGGTLEYIPQPSGSIAVSSPPGESGGSVENYRGGRSQRGQPNNTWNPDIHEWTTRMAIYGGGGGAAYGSNGGDATDERSPERQDYITQTYGGNGANASAPQNVNTHYGTGGYGGSGGGGGGGAGFLYTRSTGRETIDITETYTPGTGGTGSAGTEGIDGCVIIYY